MKALLLLLALALSGVASAQQGRRHEGKPQQMRHEDRQRMREDMNQVYRDRAQRPERPARPMSPQEREKLRQDVREAGRQLKR
jgi:hypothetical protein